MIWFVLMQSRAGDILGTDMDMDMGSPTRTLRSIIE